MNTISAYRSALVYAFEHETCCRSGQKAKFFNVDELNNTLKEKKPTYSHTRTNSLRKMAGSRAFRPKHGWSKREKRRRGWNV